jgi:hypothetical protein
MNSRRTAAQRGTACTRELRASGLCCAWLCALVAACSADTEPVKSRGGVGSAAGSGAIAAGNANSPNVLITVAPGAPGVSTGGNGCAPGHYVGAFTGNYNSAAWGNGSLPLSIAAVSSMGQPGLEFWLEKSGGGDCGGAEFCPDFTVKGGKIRGFANPFSDGSASSGSSSSGGFAIAVRFEIDFGGELDCSRGQFRGLLQNGCYDVATILFRFEGTAPASYDQKTSSFTDGMWSVKEMPMAGVLFPPDSNIGGMGSWQASLMNDNSAPGAASAGLCQM